MQIGDIVRRCPTLPSFSTNGTPGKPINGSSKEIMTGKVIYIHPRGRFHTVEFKFPCGTFKESFQGVN